MRTINLSSVYFLGTKERTEKKHHNAVYFPIHQYKPPNSFTNPWDIFPPNQNPLKTKSLLLIHYQQQKLHAAQSGHHENGGSSSASLFSRLQQQIILLLPAAFYSIPSISRTVFSLLRFFFFSFSSKKPWPSSDSQPLQTLSAPPQ